MPKWVYCVTASHIHKSDLADAHFRFSRTSFSVDEDAGLLSGSITLDTSGQIDQEILVVVQTVAGTATGKYMHALDYYFYIPAVLFYWLQALYVINTAVPLPCTVQCISHFNLYSAIILLRIIMYNYIIVACIAYNYNDLHVMHNSLFSNLSDTFNYSRHSFGQFSFF